MSPKPAKKVKPSTALEKPRGKPRTLVPRPDGKGALMTGGTNKGGPGRPPDAWKLMCQELASNDVMLEKAREVLKDKEHPAWLGAWRFVAEQGYGKPKDDAVINLPPGSKGVLFWQFGDREIPFSS